MIGILELHEVSVRYGVNPIFLIGLPDPLNPTEAEISAYKATPEYRAEVSNGEIQALLDQWSLSDRQIPQISSFTNQSLLRIYQGAMRQLMVSLGYTDQAVKVSNQAVLDAIMARSTETADSIISTTNTMLQNALNAGGNAEDFFAKVKAYNSDVLIPHDAGWARQQAVSDFMSNNNIWCQWEVVGGGPECEKCQAAMDGSPYQSEGDVPDYDHNRCTHDTVPTYINQDSLPSQGDLWFGQQVEVQAEAA
jgi:hypothetical protein